MNWILILTIISSDGVHIESVGPFFHEKYCNKAAIRWLLDIEKIKLDTIKSMTKAFAEEKTVKFSPMKFSAICVKK